MADRRAVLFGGPCDRRTLDNIPDTTESMNIPSNAGEPRHARYERVGDAIDGLGKYLRFDFVGVYDALDRPIL